MPWKLLTPMSQRKEFVSLVQTDGANMARLCRRFEISRKIGYKWLARYRATGEAGLADRSRRPHRSPGDYLSGRCLSHTTPPLWVWPAPRISPRCRCGQPMLMAS